ncbi:unnamed protein product [Prunus armeniaca]
MKCRIPMEERYFIQMAQVALKISLRKRFDGMLFGDLAELTDKASKYEELLREEQQKRNSSKGTIIRRSRGLGGKRNCSSRDSKTETSHQLQGSYKATKGSEATTIDRRVCPKQANPEQEQKRSRPTTEASSSRGKVVTRETNERPKATISAGVVLCSKCKCEAELEVVLNRQNQPTPSVFDRIGTSSRDKARQKDYLRPTQRSRRMTEHPKKEIPIKMPGNEKPLPATIEGRWYSVRKSGRPTLELTRTQKRRVQRQYCTFLKNKSDAQVFPETSSARKGKNPEVFPRAEQTSQPQKLVKAESSGKPFIHPTSSSVNQLKPSQAQDDQNGLLKAEEQEDWTEEYREEQMEYDGELDEETEAFGAELESLLQGDLGINMVFI